MPLASGSAEQNAHRRRVLDAPLGATLFHLCWPLLATSQLLRLVQVAGLFWMGNLAGALGLSVAAAMLPVMGVVSFVLGAIAVGTGTMVGKSVGARDDAGLQILGNAVLLQIVSAVVVAAFGIALIGPFTNAVSGSNEVAQGVRWFCLPWLLALPVTTIVDVLIAAVHATGWTRFGLIRVFNNLLFTICLTPLLMKYAGLGVAGLPVSSATASLILILGLAAVIVRYRAELGLGSWPQPGRVIDLTVASSLARIGYPGIAGRASFFLGMIFLTRIVSLDGKETLAGYGIAFSIILIPNTAMLALSSAHGIVVAQCRGAGRVARAYSSFKVCLVTSIVFGVAAALVMPLLRPVVAVFSGDPIVQDRAMEALGVMRWYLVAQGGFQMLTASYIACGKTGAHAIISVVSCALMVMIAFVSSGSGLWRATFAFSLISMIAAVALALVFRRSFAIPMAEAAAAATETATETSTA